MAKRKDIQPDSAAAVTPSDPEEATSSVATIDAPAITPTVAATAASDTPQTENPKPAVAPTMEASTIRPPTTPKFEEPKLDTVKSAMPKYDAPKSAAPKREEGMHARAAFAATASMAKSAAASARSNRFAMLAACVAVAAALGAIAGGLGATAITSMAAPASATNAANDTAALQATIGKLRNDLASLRTSVDTANKNAHGQFAKIGERFDRVEKAQTERGGKLAKAVEGIERLEKRSDLAPANDITGSVTSSAATAAPQSQQPIVSGWLVRDVYHGVAILQGRRFGVVEVERGDVVPGLGRIEAFKKQGGHWVVVTTRGLITTSMR